MKHPFRLLSNTWDHADALALCRALNPIAMQCGGFVALTGGTLYGEPGTSRKDVDILIYRKRQVDWFNWAKFFRLLYIELGIIQARDFGWCKKALTADGAKIDFFDPDDPGTEHNSG